MPPYQVLRYFHVLVCGAIIGGGDIYHRNRNLLAAVEIQTGETLHLVLALIPGGLIFLTEEQYKDKNFFYVNEEVPKGLEHQDLLALLEEKLKQFVSMPVMA